MSHIINRLKIGSPAKGGSCVARHEGRVIFVSHVLPGEIVDVRVVDDSKSRFWWAEPVTIVAPAAQRQVPPCPVAGLCGGCDYQHASLNGQRVMKTAVLTELLRRMAGVELAVEVASPDDGDGLGWRTRMRYLARGNRIGLRAARSAELVELPAFGCLLADPRGRGVESSALPLTGEVQVSVADSGISVLADHRLVSGDEVVTQQVLTRSFQVRADGFWQVHPRAAELLTQNVLDFLQVRPGESALDLYCGVGLFAGALVDAGARVFGIEFSRPAIELAQANVPEARFHAGRLERSLARLPKHSDVIVLDPPRSGAGKDVVQALSRLGARAICYVSCDPASLARDLGYFAKHGYQVERLKAYDLFPMTSHFETICLLSRISKGV